MNGSTRSFLFPDINVWTALTCQKHVHYARAQEWLAALGLSERLFFCRLTQLGLLRLLCTEAVLGPDEVMTQEEAWRAYDRWFDDTRVAFLEEPAGLEPEFRRLTRLRRAAPKDWADSYLAAFAGAANLTVVTFDRGFRNKIGKLILLEA